MDVTFEFAGARIQVAGEGSEHLPWLRRFLEPYITGSPRRDSSSVDWVVRVEAWRERPALSGEGMQATPLFLGKLGYSQECTDGSRNVADEKGQMLFKINPGEVRMFLPSGLVESRRHLGRTIRELLCSVHMTRGAVRLHAAAAVVGEMGVIIVGPKGAGKTTLGLHIASAQGGRFCANDRLLLRDIGTKAECLGLPIAIRVDVLTLARHTGLRSVPMGGLEFDDLTGYEASTSKRAFLPQEISDFLPTEIEGAFHPSVVIVPRRLAAENMPTVQAIRSDRVKREVLQSNIVYPDPAFPSLFEFGALRRKGSDRILTSPCFYVEWSPCGLEWLIPALENRSS